MNDLLPNLEQEKLSLQHMKNMIEKKLQDLPPTTKKLSLACLKNRTKYYIYDGCSADGKPINLKYLPVSQKDTAKAIAGREYYEREYKEVIRRLTIVNRMIRIYTENQVMRIYTSMHPGRQALISPIIPTDEEYLLSWISEEYPRKSFPEGFPDYRSERGERVRSKSEIMIADKYYYEGVPYKYERPLHLLNGFTIHPDFTLLNKRLRKEYYHEHFGMVDDPKYAASMVSRISQYQKAGIYIGEQLIITLETSTKPLTKSDLEDIIKHYLI